MNGFIVIIIAIIIRIFAEAAKEQKYQERKQSYNKRTSLHDTRSMGSRFSETETTRTFNNPNHKRTTLYDKEESSFVVKEIKKMEETEQEDYKDVIEAVEESQKQEYNFEESKPIRDPFNYARLMITIMIYVMYEDDGEFSKKEKRIVSTVIKATSIRLSSEQRKQLETLLDVRPNLDYIFMKAEDWGLNANDVFDIVQEMKNGQLKNKEYAKIFDRIQNRVTYEL